MKKNIVLSCMLIFCCCFFSCSSDDNSTKKMLPTTEVSNMSSDTEDIVTNLSTQLYASYSNGQTRALNKSSDGILTPNYFGGSYFNGSKLVVLIKNNDKQGIKDVQKRIGTSSFILYEKCSFSLNELNKLNDDLGEIYFNKKSLREKLGWTAVGINQMKNHVIVYLKELSQEKILSFKREVSSSPMIVFEQMNEIDALNTVHPDSIAFYTRAANALTNIHMGSGYTCTKTLQTNGSVGFRAKLNGKKGFVTAAHVLPATNLSVVFNSATCGTVKKVVKGPSVDAAFVEINESLFYPTNVTQWTKKVLLSSIVPYSSLTGKTVTAEGNTTRKAITGTVTITDLQYAISCNSVVGTLNYNIKRGVSATYTDQNTILRGGDSGCIVYDNSKKICGILSATSYKKTPAYMIFSSAELSVKDLGVVMY